jgi:hypothetical protein
LSIEDSEGSLLPDESDKGSAAYVSEKKHVIDKENIRPFNNDIITPKQL